MNQLFPIIRRRRRPLSLVEDAPPVVVGNVEPPKVEVGNSQHATANAKAPVAESEPNDAEISNQSESR